MTPFFNPGAHRASQDFRLHRGREPDHVPRRGRGLRRPARAPVQQPEVPARARAAGRRGGLTKAAARTATSTYVTSSFVVVGDTEQEIARQAQAVKQQIAFYASRAPTSPCWPLTAGRISFRICTASRWKATGRAWPTSSPTRCSRLMPSSAPTRTSRRDSRSATRGARPHGVLPARKQPTLGDPRLPRLIQEFNG